MSVLSYRLLCPAALQHWRDDLRGSGLWIKPIPTILVSSYHPPPLNMCRIPMIWAQSCFLPEFNAQANKCNQRKYQFSFPNNLMKHMTSRLSQSSGELNQLKATPSETLIRTSGKSRHGSTSRCTQPILPCGQISILNYIFH